LDETESARVAVVLNRRARGVRPQLINRLAQLHAREHVFVSEDLDHCRTIAHTLVQRGYERVLLGGGDGTFVRCLTELESAAEAAGVPLPVVGVLRLGTGNALGYYLGAAAPSQSGLLADLQRARGQSGRVRPLELLRVDGRLSPFAGTGLDSQILQDYGATTRFLDGLGVGHLCSSTLRYVLAVAFRATPRFFLRRLPMVEARNVGGPAYQVGPDGRPERTPLPPGTVLYRGPCTLARASTIPCLGFGARLFPFADILRGTFQLRCTDASTFETLANLPAVLRGDYRSPRIRDFLCDAVELRTEHPVPFQIGGDLVEEPRDRLRIELAEQPISVISA